MMTTANVSADNAIKTPQFWFLWTVLFCNVTAGIGILEQASPMIQDFFPDDVDAATAAGFVGLLSLFNMAGRFIWSSTSDFIGRKPTYMIYLGVGAVLFFFLATAGNTSVRRLRPAGLRRDLVLRRRLRDRAGLPQGHVRHLPGRRHPRPPAHRLVGGRRRRPADRQRHHREPARGGRRGRRRLPAVAAHHGRPAGRRLRGQPARPAGVRALPRARRRPAPSQVSRRDRRVPAARDREGQR